MTSAADRVWQIASTLQPCDDWRLGGIFITRGRGYRVISDEVGFTGTRATTTVVGAHLSRNVHACCSDARMKKPTLVEFARKRVPLFPFIPLVPIAFIAMNVGALVKLFRRTNRLERVVGIA